jgi:hypothetical protein
MSKNAVRVSKAQSIESSSAEETRLAKIAPKVLEMILTTPNHHLKGDVLENLCHGNRQALALAKIVAADYGVVINAGHARHGERQADIEVRHFDI